MGMVFFLDRLLYSNMTEYWIFLEIQINTKYHIENMMPIQKNSIQIKQIENKMVYKKIKKTKNNFKLFVLFNFSPVF